MTGASIMPLSMKPRYFGSLVLMFGLLVQRVRVAALLRALFVSQKDPVSFWCWALAEVDSGLPWTCGWYPRLMGEVHGRQWFRAVSLVTWWVTRG
jgi:hypothetical protein